MKTVKGIYAEAKYSRMMPDVHPGKIAPIGLSMTVKDKIVPQLLGTLGGGNHFIEIDKGADGSTYLVVHTGSRHSQRKPGTYLRRRKVYIEKQQMKILTGNTVAKCGCLCDNI